jgi:two-component system response regulator (stage 0 sporulation protein F)
MEMSNPEDSSPKRSPITIVLAEADADLRFLLAAVLRADGYRLHETGDGNALKHHLQQLIPVAERSFPDVLVVCDLRLRGPDALTVMRQLRDQGRRPRFILLTAFWSTHIQKEARSLGALAVFAKPFDFDDLRMVVRHLDQSDGA